MKLFYAAAALLLAACVAPNHYVMRHLQKEQGIDPGLTAEGRQNAESLSRVLPRQPRSIYVSTTRRARETAAPIAARLGLTPIEYNSADTAGLVARVRAQPRKPVLIVGHSDTVPDIVERLGGVRPMPIGDNFGQVWVIYSNGRTIVRQVGVP